MSNFLKIAVFGLSLFAWTNCGEKNARLPIDDETLVKVLADVHLSEAALSSTFGLEKDSLVLVYYDQIYKMHGISKDDFERTLFELYKRPRKMAYLYQLVTERLAQLELEQRGGDDKVNN